ncbi:MAG: hypothetical protein DRJ51_00655 [Thermoprotei archaeon]|nr:MAG: hypothetical protein DRJ51_00655 [Thermoprotei archaeon]RLF03564.1 MAG: hypothetical protein DRJ59_00020 [Thermoprotei archaeon]
MNLPEVEEKIQCPCGRTINDASEYKLLFLKKEMYEIDLLCPNDTCFLRELGFVKFRVEDDNIKIEKASFYPPFVTWNVARLGKEKAMTLLKQHLRDIVNKQIDWSKIKESVKTAEEGAGS